MDTTQCNLIGKRVKGRRVDSYIGRYPVAFERRRYSNKTFSWAFVYFENEWISLGDPWPSVKVPVKELLSTVERILVLINRGKES